MDGSLDMPLPLRIIFCALRIVLLCAVAATCVPANAVTQKEVEAGAEHLYRARVIEAQQSYQLDSDHAFLTRVQRVLFPLIDQAKRDYPESADFAWEIHTIEATDESASCMAGGKLLVGQPYVARLELDDAELAMLLSHEIEHAVLLHNLKEFREALRLEPARQQQTFSELEYAIDHDEGLMKKLSSLNAAQESEADHEGLLLAWRAGWPAQRLVNLYKKMAHADPAANFDSLEHPSAARRWQEMKSLSNELNRKATNDAPQK
jgi:predicted Zn-dependent protease